MNTRRGKTIYSQKTVILSLVNVLMGLLISSAIGAELSPPETLDEMYRDLVNRRGKQIDRLRTYSARGHFPRNTDFPGRYVPYFVDRFGTHCAVGYLVHRDDRDDIVNGVVLADNHILIRNVHDGPLTEWMLHSGLTQEECALIQPGYPQIEYYREYKQWKEEVDRLQAHFARVEKVLRDQQQQSLEARLRDLIHAELQGDSPSPALAVERILPALSSDEANVRTGAAYALASLPHGKLPQADRITALVPNLDDPSQSVRFWTATALERISSPSWHGRMRIHALTLPVFLDTLRGQRDDLRIAALVQLTEVAPKAVSTSKQLQIIKRVRQAVVAACDDDNEDVRAHARRTLATWRWQRFVDESRRMQLHYRADSFELERLSAETAMLGRVFAKTSTIIESLDRQRPFHLLASSVMYLAPGKETLPTSIADDEEQASNIVTKYFEATYRHREDKKPFWRIDRVETTKAYFLVHVYRTDHNIAQQFVVLRPAILQHSNCGPSHWINQMYESGPDGASREPPIQRVRDDLEIVLSKSARTDQRQFAIAADILAWAMVVNNPRQLVVDREVNVDRDSIVWRGRFARMRHTSRFHQRGGGGWDFHQIEFRCDRKTGQLAVSVSPIKFSDSMASGRMADAKWLSRELKYMGWQSLPTIKVFATELLPQEYSQAVDMFKARKVDDAWKLIRERYRLDTSLPRPELIWGWLHANDPESADHYMQLAAGYGQRFGEPNTLARVAQWEAMTGQHERARKHAQAALNMDARSSLAKNVIAQLDSENKSVGRR